jgi:CrcB protein
VLAVTVLGWLAVGVLAVAGAFARSLLDRELSYRTASAFPVSILAINASGSLALGVIAGAGASGWTLRLLGSALVGSYTTFSTWIVDTGELAAARELRWAGLNLAGSIGIGLAAVAVGWTIGGAL